MCNQKHERKTIKKIILSRKNLLVTKNGKKKRDAHAPLNKKICPLSLSMTIRLVINDKKNWKKQGFFVID
jgi:hypothetical protein